MNYWQPIEEAPLDGSTIVLLGNVGFGPCQAFARWFDGHWETPDGLIVSEISGWRSKMLRYERYILSRNLNFCLRSQEESNDWD